jgi:hypothetical protein
LRITCWTKNIETDISDGGNGRRLAWAHALRYAATIRCLAAELLRVATTSCALQNLFHTAWSDAGGAGEGRNDGAVQDAGYCGGERFGGVRCEGAGDIRPDKNREVRKVVGNAIEFARNPKNKQYDSEGVTAVKDEGEDSEALLRPASALIDSVDRGLVVTDPKKEAGRGGGPFDVMPKHCEFTAVRIDKLVRVIPREGTKLRGLGP